MAIDNARLYRQAERASAAKSEFLAAMSHEFRTPVNVILGYADLLAAGIPAYSPEVAREQAGRIRVAGEHLLALVEQVLSVARLEAGRETVRLDDVDIGALTREMALLVEPLAVAKRLRFRVEAPEGRVVIRTDAGKLRQILYNLLANAVKFTDRGDVVLAARLEHGPAGPVAVVDVRDTGIGIAPEHLDAVFEAFWQAEREPGVRSGAEASPAAEARLVEARPAGGSTAGPRSGTGLGLSISRELARLLGGDLRVRSTVGQGSTFTLVLPASGPATRPATAPARPGASDHPPDDPGGR